MSIVPPRPMTNNDVSDTPELSGGGGGAQLVPSRVSVVLVEVTIAEDTPGRGCPGEDHKMSPLADTKKPSSETVSDDDNRSPCVGGGEALPPSVVSGGLLPVDVTDAPALSVEGSQSVPSRISVVRVDGTIAADIPVRECPREDREWRPRAGVTRPAGVSVGGGGTGSLRGGGTLSSLDVAGSLLLVVPAGGSLSGGAVNPAGPDGPVVAGGCHGPWETLSPIFLQNSETVKAFGS